MKTKVVAYLRDVSDPRSFGLTIPSLFSSFSRLDREDILEYFKENEGKWEVGTTQWVFPYRVLAKIPGILQTFGIGLVSQRTAPIATAIQLIQKPIAPVIEEPKKVIVQVPEKLVVGPNDPAVQRILETTYARLEAEFRRLHLETGVTKTKMREILSKSVPAVVASKTGT